MKLVFYNLAFADTKPLPVTVHLARDRRFVWRRILGWQIGPWFIGTIKGSEQPATLGAVDPGASVPGTPSTRAES